ncbi:MAG: hypothetical protein WCE64_13385 [Bacteroidales bacterium]
MKTFLKPVVFLLLTFCFSCEKQGWIVDCSTCVSQEPTSAILEIRTREIGSSPIVNVYRGELEDSVLVATLNVSYGQTKMEADLNELYTLTATYFVDGIKYIVVNSVTPGLKYVKDQCDDPCYFVYNNKVDLRLKYLAKKD